MLLAFGFTLVPFAAFHIHLIMIGKTTLEYGYRNDPELVRKRKNVFIFDFLGDRRYSIEENAEILKMYLDLESCFGFYLFKQSLKVDGGIPSISN